MCRQLPAIAEEICEQKFTVVAASAMIGYQLAEALELIKRVKEMNAEIKTVIGGAAATMLPRELLSECYVDFVVRGQGEETFQRLLMAAGDPDLLSAVEGLSFRTKDGRIVSNPNRRVQRRSHFSPFDFSLIPVEDYIQNDKKIGQRTINYIASQGCPFNCGFCSDTNLYDQVWTGYDPDTVVEEIERMVRAYSVDGVKFYDSNFIVNVRQTARFATELLNHGVRIKWAASVHPVTFLRMDDPTLDLLVASGCCRLLVGVESGSQEVLDLVGKKMSPRDILTIAERAKARDICVSFTGIVGFPGVADDHVNLTFAVGEKVRAIDPRHEFKVHIYAPYPLTSLYDRAVEYGFAPPATLAQWASYDYYASCTPWTDETLQRRVAEFNGENSSAVSRV